MIPWASAFQRLQIVFNKPSMLLTVPCANADVNLPYSSHCVASHDSPRYGGGSSEDTIVFGTLAAIALILPMNANAVEVSWDGHYRTSVQAFNSLSLASKSENENAEGAAWWANHRLRLAPAFLLSENVTLFTEVDVLPFVNWGDSAQVLNDPITGDPQPGVFAHSVSAPPSADGAGGLQNINVRRVFGEITTPVAKIRFGRMPVHWGSGMVYNAGNGPLDEYGDTSDRIQITAPVGKVHLIGAFETNTENYINTNDDLKTITGAVAFLGERSGIGTYNTYRWQRFDKDADFSLFTGDIWAEAQLGGTHLEWEFAFQLGGGDYSESVNDVRVTGLGSHLSAVFGNDRFRMGVAGGFATGDADPFDAEYSTFSFDPDFNLTLMMFEEPMPVLMHANPHPENNGGREYGAVQLGDGISNAMYMRPVVQMTATEGLDFELAWFAAQAAKLSEAGGGKKGYGSELDLTVDYRPFDHFELSSTTGIFFPGKYFQTFEHEELGGGFKRAAFGTRLVGTVSF